MKLLKIKLRRWRMVGLLLALLIILIPLGYWLLTVEASVLAAERRSPLLVRSLGAFLLCVAALLAIISIPRLVSLKPGLILDDTGLTDNTNIFGNGHIPWSDICGFHFGEAEHVRLLFVIVDRPQQYLEKRSWLSRTLARARERRGDPSPFCIPVKNLAISEHELAEHLLRYASESHARTALSDR
jgi:hypothetical protein